MKSKIETEGSNATEHPNREPRAAGRRRVLKALGAGGGVLAAGANLPDKWGKPVVDAVFLPAHAQTSGGCEVNCQDTRIVGTYGLTNYDGPGPHNIAFLMGDMASPSSEVVPFNSILATLGAGCSGGSVDVTFFTLDGTMNIPANSSIFNATYNDADSSQNFRADGVPDLTGNVVDGDMYSMIMNGDYGTAVFTFGSNMCTVEYTFVAAT